MIIGLVQPQKDLTELAALEETAANGILTALKEFPKETKCRRTNHKKRRLAAILKDNFPVHYKQWLEFVTHNI